MFVAILSTLQATTINPRNEKQDHSESGGGGVGVDPRSKNLFLRDDYCQKFFLVLSALSKPQLLGVGSESTKIEGILEEWKLVK